MNSFSWNLSVSCTNSSLPHVFWSSAVQAITRSLAVVGICMAILDIIHMEYWTSQWQSRGIWSALQRRLDPPIGCSPSCERQREISLPLNNGKYRWVFCVLGIVLQCIFLSASRWCAKQNQSQPCKLTQFHQPHSTASMPQVFFVDYYPQSVGITKKQNYTQVHQLAGDLPPNT